MVTFKGHPHDGGLYTRYDVVRDSKMFGVIEIGGYFKNETNAELSAKEKIAIEAACKRIYEMPSEYGCLGVGEPPTVPYEYRDCQ